jgi:hypothetical protein
LQKARLADAGLTLDEDHARVTFDRFPKEAL